MDIEWIENAAHHINPTQIAAIRTDEQWNSLDRFYARIHPRDSSFHIWNHVAYSGGTASAFLLSAGIYRVLTNLQNWLQEDDVICFWFEESQNILKSIYQLVLKTPVTQRIVVLDNYLPFFAAFTHRQNRQGLKTANPYLICKSYGITTEEPKHHSENDVLAMQAALRCIQYPSEYLHEAPPSAAELAEMITKPQAKAHKPKKTWPYQLEKSTGICHKSGCSKIPDNAALTGYPNLSYFLRKKLKPCPDCLSAEMRAAIRARNQDIIDRSSFQFVFSDHSNVFHRRDCPAILSTIGVIYGSTYYRTCIARGLRPCQRCHPSPITQPSKTQKIQKDVEKQPTKKVSHSKTHTRSRSLTIHEQSAYKRYVEARKERFSPSAEIIRPETEKKTFLRSHSLALHSSPQLAIKHFTGAAAQNSTD